MTFAGLDTKKGIQMRSSKVSLLNAGEKWKGTDICHTSSGMTFMQAAFDEEMFLLIFSGESCLANNSIMHNAKAQLLTAPCSWMLRVQALASSTSSGLTVHWVLPSVYQSITHAPTHCSPQSVQDKPTPVERSQRTWQSFPQERLNISTANNGHLCPSRLRLHLMLHAKSLQTQRACNASVTYAWVKYLVSNCFTIQNASYCTLVCYASVITLDYNYFPYSPKWFF